MANSRFNFLQRCKSCDNKIIKKKFLGGQYSSNKHFEFGADTDCRPHLGIIAEVWPLRDIANVIKDCVVEQSWNRFLLAECFFS